MNAQKLYLTDREIAIARRLREGQPPKQIAAELAISRRTVRFHVENLRAKVHAASYVEACIFFASIPCLK